MSLQDSIKALGARVAEPAENQIDKTKDVEIWLSIYYTVADTGEPEVYSKTVLIPAEEIREWLGAP